MTARTFLPMCLALAVLTSTAAQPAHAQVQRCTDPHTGHITYTDSACPQGERQVQIQAAPTPQERAAQAAQYQQALARRHAEQALEAERAAARQAAIEAEAARHLPPAVIHTAPPSPPPTTVVVPHYSGPRYAPPPIGWRPPVSHGHPPPPAVAPPPPLQSSPTGNCNVFRCYDGKGNTQPRP